MPWRNLTQHLSRPHVVDKDLKSQDTKDGDKPVDNLVAALLLWINNTIFRHLHAINVTFFLSFLFLFSTFFSFQMFFLIPKEDLNSQFKSISLPVDYLTIGCAHF